MRCMGINEFDVIDVDTGYATPCHIPLTWRGVPMRLNNEGYSQFHRTVDGVVKTVRAHTVRFRAAHGVMPEGFVPDHLCRNRACCNVDHMEAVSAAENVRRGIRTKLTRETVADIVRLRAGGESCASLAKKFNVDPSVISRSSRGENWSDGPAPAWSRVKSRRNQAGRAERRTCRL